MRRTYTIGIICILGLLGFGGWYLANSLEREREAVSAVTGEAKPCTAHEQPTNMFATISGEEYDKAFIVDMLAHHEGAVNMAESALASTERSEIRELATAIIDAQSQEIAKMRSWQQEWGYPITAAEGHAGHGADMADSMGDSMMAMTDGLRGLTDETFDQKFLELMIEHHQQAVDMSKYAETNAFHTEIKDLGKAIIATQDTEIKTMKEWQKSWGFPVAENKKSKNITACEL